MSTNNRRSTYVSDSLHEFLTTKLFIFEILFILLIQLSSLNQLIHAIRLPVVQTVNVEKITAFQFALVCKALLVMLRIVDQNVSSVQNAILTKLAFSKSAEIHVQARAVQMLIVELITTVRFVTADKDILEMRFPFAAQFLVC